MYRSQDYAFCGGERSVASPGLRLVQPHWRAGDGEGSMSSDDDGWPELDGVPAVANVTDRLSDRKSRGTPITASAIAGLTDRLFRHLTHHLGSVSAAWSTDPAGSELGFQVVEYAPGRIDGAVLYSTLGLSDYILDSPTAEGRFRLELIMVAPEHLRGSALPFVLGDYGRMVLALRELPEIGTIVRNVPILADLSSMDTLYLGQPPHFPPDFARFRSGELAVNIDWLLPVSAAEATFVDAEGWAAFEKLIYESEDFDPIDYDRPSMPV